MLTARRALSLNISAGAELPRVPALRKLYEYGVRPRQGEQIMIAGRSGTQKSGFALWWTLQMNLPTLYFSADMSPFQASARTASCLMGETTESVEIGMRDARVRAEYMERLKDCNISFSFGSPIRWANVEQELNAYVETWNSYPNIIVIDNLMDVEYAESDYTEQMNVMQSLHDLGRETGMNQLVLHHASDKSMNARSDPYSPPGRDEIKNGLGEKPELVLGVALDPHNQDYRIAPLKQRMGKCDPTGRSFVVMKAVPELTRFEDMP